jgi:translation elongation factor EF-Tu-like GTPase
VGEPLELTITDVFVIHGQATVVTGRVARGTARLGDSNAMRADGAVRAGVAAEPPMER